MFSPWEKVRGFIPFLSCNSCLRRKSGVVLMLYNTRICEHLNQLDQNEQSPFEVAIT